MISKHTDKSRLSRKRRVVASVMALLITVNLSFTQINSFAVDTTKSITSSSSSEENWDTYEDIPNCSKGKTSKGYEWEKKDGIFYVKYGDISLMVANKSYSLPSSYNPGGLTSSATGAFNSMNAKYKEWAKTNNPSIPELTICSGFRSYDTQLSLYNNYVSTNGKSKADTFSARAGHSEHQTGLGIDIVSAESSNYSDEANKSTKDITSKTSSYDRMAMWLKENAPSFGFILRYPKGKDTVTGYKYEPWHYRFISGDPNVSKKIMDAGTLEEFFGLTSKYDTVDKFSSDTLSALEEEIQKEEEDDDPVAIIDAPEDEVISQLNASQKDAYMIIANKHMTDIELQAMEWNLIVSQFAVPYKENIQDVWNHKAFKDMRDTGLIIDDNPYLSSIQNNLRALNSKALEEAIDLGINITGEDDATIKTLISDIADCMLEDGEVMYSPVYNGTSYAYVSDLFKKDTYAFTVKDKIAVTGDASTQTELQDALQSMQDNYLVTEKSNVDLAKDVMAGSSIYDVELPVWINTDGTMLYNAIYVANAIRVGGYGSYDNFIKSVGNSQLYIDRWGNLCAHLRIDGEYKYVLVYPAYSNPIFTSTEINDDDFAGYVYDNFNNPDLYKKLSSKDIGKFWDLDVVKEAYEDLVKDGKNNNWGTSSVFTIEPKSVAKDYKTIKNIYINGNIDNLEAKDFLGVKEASSINRIEPKTSNGESFSGVKSRERSNFIDNRHVIPIMEVDTTTNMVFNKAILSAYSRDSYSKISNGTGESLKDGGSTSYYKNKWYDCLNDSNTTYSSFALTSQYNKNNKSALFSNSIVFDKYYTDIMMGGASFSGDIKKNKGYTIDKNGIVQLQEACTTVGLSKWKYNNNHYVINTLNEYVHSSSKGLKTTDTTSSVPATVQYPFMQLHSYRKGLYSDTPNLQATKSGKFSDSFGGLNMLVADQYVSKSFNYENTVSVEDDDYRSRSKFIPIELYWDAMCTDSDKFRTYVVLNYTNEMVPSNSVIYGMGHRLTKSNQGSTYHVAVYMDELIGKKEVMGRNYMSIPLMDATIDTGTDWKIWDNNGVNKEDKKYFIDSKQDGIRKRSMPYYDSSGNMVVSNLTTVKNATFFEPVALEDNNGGSALRFILNDQRVSDVLENYPLEDITLLSFVWRNYYTPQTPFRTKLNVAIADKTDDKSSDSSDKSNDKDGKDDDDNDSNVDKSYKLKYDDVEFDLSSEHFLGSDTVLTPYNAISAESKNVNNNLLWTQACSSAKENQISLHDVTHSGSMIGETEDLYVDTSYLYRASYNFGILVLSINKNTEGDNLTNLVSGYDSVKEFDTDQILDKISAFFEHPVISLSNMFMGFLQMIHNNLAVGNIGNVFDISWVIDLALSKNILKIYIIVSVSICCIVLILRGLRYILDKKIKLSMILKEWLCVVCLSTVPVILLYNITNGLHFMSSAMTKEVAGQLAMVEIEKEITASENLNIDFETVYTAYKEQFAGIEDGYSKLAMKVPTSYSASTGTMTYDTVTIKELYDSIEYSNVLAKAKLEAATLESQASEDTDVTRLYLNQNVGIPSMYYSYSEFIPVNYDKYDDNIFYYFYDWIKYQYLAYWASQSDGNSSAFSAAAKKFSLPETDSSNKEKWSAYIGRMWDAELYMLEKSYNGMYLMYHDDKYVYNKLFDSNGSSVYAGQYVTDLFGLSYMFNMTDSHYVSKGYMEAPSLDYINALNEDEENSLGIWQQNVKSTFNSELHDYGTYLQRIGRNKAFELSTSIPAFYPLAYIMDNPTWPIIKNNREIVSDAKSNNIKDYCFTPSYLEEEFGETEWYEGYPKISSMNASLETMTHSGIDYRKNDALLYSDRGAKRLPWRLYASNSTLVSNTFDGDKYCKDFTDLEYMLMDCNKDAYKKIKQMTEYLQGDIRDSSLIFATALVATMEFNKTFSNSLFSSSQIEPQSFTEDSMDLDKFLRVTYAEDMDSIVKNNNVVYMIYEQDGGIATAILVVATEICIALCMLMRIAVLILMLLGCAYVCIFHGFHPPKTVHSMVVGLVTQLMQVVASQFILLFVITKGMFWVNSSNTTITRLLLSMLVLIICIALTQWSKYMLTAMIKDFRNFGGAIIRGNIESINTRLQSAYSEIKNNSQLNNIQAQMRNFGYNMSTPAVATGMTIDPLMIRSRNATRMDNVANSYTPYQTYQDNREFSFDIDNLTDSNFSRDYLRKNYSRAINEATYRNALDAEALALKQLDLARERLQTCRDTNASQRDIQKASKEMNRASDIYNTVHGNVQKVIRHQKNARGLERTSNKSRGSSSKTNKK